MHLIGSFEEGALMGWKLFPFPTRCPDDNNFLGSSLTANYPFLYEISTPHLSDKPLTVGHISWKRTARSYLSVSRPGPLGCRLWLWELSQNSWPFSSSQASYPSVYLSHRYYTKFYADANEPSLSLRLLKLLSSDVCPLKAHPGNPARCTVFVSF